MREFIKVKTIRVRYVETDAMGIVWNGNYLSYFEIGRTELMRSYGLPYAELENNGYQLPLIDTYVKFIKPARYDNEIEIFTKIVWDGGVKIKFEYEIRLENDIITKGYTNHTFINSVSKKPIKPPKIFREIIGKVIDIG